jgi:hypothetical protein
MARDDWPAYSRCGGHTAPRCSGRAGHLPLVRVLPLPVFLEHHVDPLAWKGVLQCNPGHHARRCMPLKLLEDRGPNGPAPVHLCNRGKKNGAPLTPTPFKVLPGLTEAS